MRPRSTVRSLLSSRDDVHRAVFVEAATGRFISWADIAGLSADLHHLAHPDLTLGLSISDPIEMTRWFLGALAAGISVAPLDPLAPDHEQAGLAERLEIGALASDRHGDGVQLVTQAGKTRRPGVHVVLASSGTTGQPKVIPLRERQLLDAAASVVRHHRIGRDDRGYSPLPLFHINGLVVGLLSTLVADSSLVIDRRLSATGLWETVEDNGVTWLNLVPALITIISNRPAPDPRQVARVRFVRSASAPLAVDVLRRFEERCGIGILETYGMTETASQITANPLLPSERRPGSVGLPVGVEVAIVGDDGRRVVDGSVGEVVISGTRVTGGGPLRTGDLGWLDHDGYLFLVARKDDVINRGGEKVYPAEIEAVLLGEAHVAAAVVVGRSHPVIGQEPVAYVLVADPSGTDRAALLRRLETRCAVHLSRYKRPVEIIVTDTLPAGPTGKVRRVEVRDWAATEMVA